MGKPGLGRAALAALAMLFAQVSAASGLTGSETIDTYAGSGTAGSSGDGGPATSARLTARGVAADEMGNVYVADPANHVVRKIDPGGTISAFAGNGTAGFSGDGGPAAAASLNAPMDVAVDGQGNVYIADRSNNRIRKVSAATGIIITIAGNGSGTGFSGDGGPATQASLGYPMGVGVSRGGVVYIPDADNQRVRRVKLDGTIETIAGDGRQVVNGPAGDGGPALQASFGNPTDVAVDRAGNIYVADVGRAAVRRIDSAGIISRFAGGGTLTAEGAPASQFQLGTPWYVAVDAYGNVYVSDSASSVNRVYKVDVSSLAIITVAGSGNSPGFGGDGGMARNARLHSNFGVAMDPVGALYIADMGNARIRRVSGPGPLNADLRIAKSCTPACVDVNQTIDCTITVDNDGPGATMGIQVTDVVSTTGGVALQSATPSNGICPIANAAAVICDLGALQPGEQATVRIALRAGQNGAINDTAAVSALQSDPQQSNNSASGHACVGSGSADLEIVKESAGSVRVGQEARFSIRVVNHGPDAATNVVVTDIGNFARVLPHAGWNLQSTSPVSVRLATLAAGAISPVIEVTVAAVAEGQVCNPAASVTADQQDPVAGNNVVANVCVDVARAFALSEFVAFSDELTGVGARSNVHSGAIGTNRRRGATSAAQVETLVRGPSLLGGASFVLGETVRLEGAAVANVRANDPVQLANGAVATNVQPAGSLPILTLPALQAANPETSSSGDVTVADNQTRTLAPGRYRNIVVGANATLYLRGYSQLLSPPNQVRSYDFARLTLGAGAKLLFTEPGPLQEPGFYAWGNVVRVQARVSVGASAYVGPVAGAVHLKPRNLKFLVGGTDSVVQGGALFAVTVNGGADLHANVYAPNGSIYFSVGSKGTGAFIAKRVAAEAVDWTLDSGF